ncbi:MAG: hypothetical protein IT454_22485 [Planctomycetes bacterium]|nr:hypothetical protein [Planctomycetota bacterium]
MLCSPRTATLALLCSALASSARAQSFSYPDFSTSTNLVLNGNATVAGNILRVTPAAASQRGAVWYAQPLSVVGGFQLDLRFQFSGQVFGGADGLAIVFQNDPRTTAALGSATAGSCIGYADNPANPAGVGIQNSLALEIDTYDAGSPFFDVSGADFSWHTNGTLANDARESFSIGWVTPSVDFTDGLVHALSIQYVPGTLSVKYDGNLVLTTNYNFTTGGTWTGGGAVGGLNLINGTSLYVGITGATGGVYENNDVLSWNFSSSSTGPSTYCTAGTSTAGCNASINANANPSLSFANACTISVTNVEGQKNGIVFYALNQLVQPWSPTSTSFLCVKTPTQRTLSQTSGGTAGQCNGTFTLDWNAFQLANPGALGNPWTAGATAHCQAWYRDPPASKTTNLSNAVTLTYQP